MTNKKIKFIEERKIFNIGKAKLFKLASNDLKIVLLQNKIAPLLSFQIWYDVGSGDETGEIKTGQAHFLEHMMFRGTKKYPEGVFDKILGEAGANGSNAFTGSDYTAYTVETPTKELELVLELESDRMSNLDLNEESLNIERGAILNERTLRVDDDPNGFGWEELLKNIYKGSSYQHDTIGSKKDIEEISVKDCQDFYKQYYTPNNATIVITGDFEEESTLNLIDKYFSPIEKSEIIRNENNLFNINPNNKVIEHQFDILSDKFIIAYKAMKFLDEDFLKLKILSILLTDIRSSFFKKEYIDTDKLMGINTDLLYLKKPSIFVIEGTLKRIKKEDFLNKLDEDLTSFIAKLSENDLSMAKKKFKVDITVLLSSNYKSSSLFGESISLTSSPFYIYDNLSHIDNISLEDIKSTFNKYIKPKNRLTVFLSKRNNDKI